MEQNLTQITSNYLTVVYYILNVIKTTRLDKTRLSCLGTYPCWESRELEIWFRVGPQLHLRWHLNMSPALPRQKSQVLLSLSPSQVMMPYYSPQ